MARSAGAPRRRAASARRWLGRHAHWVGAAAGVVALLVAALVVGPQLTAAHDPVSPAAPGSAEAPGEGAASPADTAAPARPAVPGSAEAPGESAASPADAAPPSSWPVDVIPVTARATVYTPRDRQQAGACQGAPAVAPADLRLLDPDTTVTGGVVCLDVARTVPGDGRWTVRETREIPPAALARLLDALRGPDLQLNGGACTAMLITAPDFVLTTADGRAIRPGMPGDGCHLQDAAVAAFAGDGAWPLVSEEPVAQVATEPEVVTGCNAGASTPATWLEVGPGRAGTPAALPLPAGGSFSVCHYAPDSSDKSGILVGVGTVAGADINRALTDLPAPPLTCAAVGQGGTAPRTDWLFVQPVPAAGVDVLPLGAPAVMIEIGGCHRVVDGRQLTVLGTLAPQVVSGWATGPAR